MFMGGDNRHPFLLPDLRGEVVSLSLLSRLIAGIV